ncbi:MAG: hypothetical protein A3G24_01135 [Betaproteobacteria bacterium RIFCSPLOWO2_12_FULL_62_13]|nr:MAG: hypothetical protein A3G24_01135 [Betaproteobacteria bacterium RIFCSPLOWO2_12_FULL_62_13]
MASQTSLDILNLDDRTLQLRLAQGDVDVRVRALASDETIVVDTPSGAVLPEQPGSYRISAGRSGDAATVIVHFGRAQVLTNTSGFPLHANQQVRLGGADGAPSEIAAAPPGDEFDRWSAARDKREDHIAATRYVSPDTTGYEDLDAHGTWRTMPEYGAVWVPTAVAAGWAPYRHGHWVWVEPWGWTWVDDAPWGFARFHYGRWVWLNGYWAWAPGPRIARPVYAPALVAFIGGSRWSVSVASGGAPAVGWFPLGWREPYVPWYRASPTHVRNVNITHVKNINVTNIYNDVTQIQYVNRNHPHAVTVVPRKSFVSAEPVARTALRVAPAQLAQAQVVNTTTPAQPARESLARQQPGPRPPAATIRREVVGMRAPPVRAAQGFAATSPDAAQQEARRPVATEQPRVRVIGQRRSDTGAPGRQLGSGTPQGSGPQAATPDNVPRPPQADVKTQPRSVPQALQRQVERRKPSTEEAAPQARADMQRQRRAPGNDAATRATPPMPAQRVPQREVAPHRETRGPGPEARGRGAEQEPAHDGERKGRGRDKRD